jgi:hypothetical protein
MLPVREPRFSSNLSVLVTGRDTYGNPFKQTATVENISRRGGLLTGIRCLRAPGDLIEVACRGRKAVFRVVWMDVPLGNVGICCTEHRCIWSVKLLKLTPVSSPISLPELDPRVAETGTKPERIAWNSFAVENNLQLQMPSSTGQLCRPEKRDRRFPRYRSSGGVAATAGIANPTRVWGRLTVIGMGGCYVETLTPFLSGTKLDLLVGAHGLQVRLHGQVRCCHPNVGMGIMFTVMTDSEKRELEQMIAAVSGRL